MNGTTTAKQDQPRQHTEEWNEVVKTNLEMTNTLKVDWLIGTQLLKEPKTEVSWDVLCYLYVLHSKKSKSTSIKEHTPPRPKRTSFDWTFNARKGFSPVYGKKKKYEEVVDIRIHSLHHVRKSARMFSLYSDWSHATYIPTYLKLQWVENMEGAAV